MVVSPNSDREREDYRRFVYYDRLYPPFRVEERFKSGQTLPGTSSVNHAYTVHLVYLIGMPETSSLSTTRVGWMFKGPTDEELWLSLIGVFESRDPHFAEHHDGIYGPQS